ncbi:MAG: hypothetical protein RR716_01155 [Christensenellaceae bacterium]
MKKRLLSITCLIVAVMMIATPAFAADQSKDETIYANLNYDGSVQDITIVNRLSSETPQTEFVDYGSYTNLQNLTNDVVAQVSEDQISFTTQALNELYYQGTASGELPYLLHITYTLDGKKVDAQALAGASGKCEIAIKITQNKKCPEKVRKGLMAQLSLTLSMDKAKNLVLSTGNPVVVGKNNTVSFVVLPDSDGDFKLNFDAENFEMGSININIIGSAFDVGSIVDETSSQVLDAFDSISDGVTQAKDGTSKLKDGTVKITSAVDSITGGLTALNNSSAALNDGLSQLVTGAASMANGLPALGTGSQAILGGLEKLNGSTPAIITGFDGIAGGISGLKSGNEQLCTAANAVIAGQAALAALPPELQGAILGLANGVNAQNAGISALNDVTAPFKAGLGSLQTGISDLYTNYGTFHAGLQGLPGGADALKGGLGQVSDGVKQYTNGVADITAGMSKLNSNISSLPADVQKLVNGQSEIVSGIHDGKEEMQTKMDEYTVVNAPVSFASPDKNTPSTVQYLMHTPEIKLPAKETPVIDNVDHRNFWEKLVDLFR